MVVACCVGTPVPRVEAPEEDKLASSLTWQYANKQNNLLKIILKVLSFKNSYTLSLVISSF